MLYVVLKEINHCTLEQKKVVRTVRNELSVRKCMYTDHEIYLDEHLDWIEGLRSDYKQIVFVVFVDSVVSGVVSVNEIDSRHKKSDWAFYLSENVRGGLGAALEFSLLDFVFNHIKLEKLNCEVIETNENVVKMHKKFGFIQEGFRRSNVEKNGERKGVYFLGITKKEWLDKRSKISKMYESILSKFDISIEYDHG